MMNIQKTAGGQIVPETYEVRLTEQIEDIHAGGTLLRHKKTGARILLLENDDDNKVFTVGFRTPPQNSTGVAHILEHSVLCGSRNFPLKDPFVELVKGSLNTFLNAMTYPDKTIYPVASCNDQDFQNLMHVYMDAVFYPNIYDREEIFRQEGWSYQLESVDAPLKYNGVVYNEMKGAFSSAEEFLNREIFNSLFPDTPYGVESGGDPACIPELDYEEFLDFHRSYYHPSNSYIYLYGDMDMNEKLRWLDEAYLSKFEERPVDSAIPAQKPFDKRVEKEIAYPVLDSDPLEQNSYLTYNLVVGSGLDVELNLAMQILDYVLLSAPGAPVKQRLLDEGIGKDVSSSYEDGILQPFFSIVAKNADAADKERFLALIREELEKICDEGIPGKAIASGINYFEFRFREADFASYPKGLIYGMDTFDSWLYDDGAPFDYLKQLKIFADLRGKAKEGYFESLIRKYFLENTHSSVLVSVPERGLEVKKEKEREKTMAAKKAGMSRKELEELAAATRHLEEYQDEEDSSEVKACIPLLRRSDIRREARKLYNTEHVVDGVKVLQHDVFTNGIAYLQLLFDISRVPDELIPYMGLLKSVLGYIGTEHYTFGELFHEINASSGGIACGIQIFNDEKDAMGCRRMFGVRAKYLYSQREFVFSMIREILLTSKLTDTRRLHEILSQIKAENQMSLAAAGHSTAVLRANSYYSAMAGFQDRIGGVAYARFIKDLEENFEEKKSMLADNLQKLMKMIFRPELLTVSITADAEGYAGLDGELRRLCGELYADKVDTGSFVWEPARKNEGLKTAGQVQYVARCGNFRRAGYEYTGALRILKVIMSYDYLWMNIRVKGGAYGCMNLFRRNGDTSFVSYRDPNLKETVAVFERAADYVAHFEADERTMDQYVIGAVSDMDTPLTPSARGEVSLNAWFSGITEEMLQKERDQVLAATPEDIRRLSGMVKAVMDQGNFCVVGSETAVEENAGLFDQVENLL